MRRIPRAGAATWAFGAAPYGAAKRAGGARGSLWGHEPRERAPQWGEHGARAPPLERPVELLMGSRAAREARLMTMATRARGGQGQGEEQWRKREEGNRGEVRRARSAAHAKRVPKATGWP